MDISKLIFIIFLLMESAILYIGASLIIYEKLYYQGINGMADFLRSKFESKFEINDQKKIRTETLEILNKINVFFTEEQGNYSDFLIESNHLLSKINNNNFYLSILGQFKRGKSSILNALLGTEIVPSSVLPLTTVPTLIKKGDSLQVTVYFKNSHETFLATTVDKTHEIVRKYGTEEGNKKNKLNVQKIEISINSSFLQNNVVLIDTPGIGSTNAHNTEATNAFLSECDTGLFIFSPDPPITETEIKFLANVRKHIPNLFFVLNKADYLTDPEELKQTLGFISSTLKQHFGEKAVGHIFTVSAKKAIDAVKQGTNDKKSLELLKQSGIELLRHKLTEFFINQKDTALVQAVLFKTKSLIVRAIATLKLSREAISMPVEQLNKKIILFEEKIKESERQLDIIDDIIEHDKKKCLSMLEKQASEIRKIQKQNLKQIVSNLAKKNEKTSDLRKKINESFRENIPKFFNRELGDFAKEIDMEIKKIVDQNMNQFKKLTNKLEKDLSGLFGVEVFSEDNKFKFKIKKTPYWRIEEWSPGLSPIPVGFFDSILPKKLTRYLLLKQIDERINDIATINVEQLRWETVQSLNAIMFEVKKYIHSVFFKTVTTIRSLLKQAREKRSVSSETVNQLSVILSQAIENLQKELNKCADLMASD